MLENVLKLREEMRRRSTKRHTLLDYLQKHGSITTKDLWRFGGTGASSRLHELKETYKISDAIYMEPGLYKYVFRGKKTDKVKKAKDWDKFEQI